MKKLPKFYLKHIVFECEQILKYTEKKSKSDLEEDYLLFSGLCRMLTVIGEAVAKLPDDMNKKYPSVPWSNMRAMRNVLVHQYHNLDYDIILNVAKQEIPGLLPLLKSALDEENKTTV